MQHQQITAIRPNVIFSTSAVLDEATRQLLKSVFQTRVVDMYASEEGRSIAWECDRCPGYHVNADLLVLEILKNGEPAPLGDEGEITITNLHSFAMPFIRFRQGDVGVLAKERPICGRGLPLLKRIEGRTDDFIVLSSGRKLSPRLFYYALWSVPGVAEFRLVQQSLDRLDVEFVTREGFDDHSRQLATDNLRQLVGNDVEITFSLVSAIPRDSAEKFRSFISMVDDRDLNVASKTMLDEREYS
jgi:phenylacetate-CoA ligase